MACPSYTGTRGMRWGMRSKWLAHVACDSFPKRVALDCRREPQGDQVQEAGTQVKAASLSMRSFSMKDSQGLTRTVKLSFALYAPLSRSWGEGYSIWHAEINQQTMASSGRKTRCCAAQSEALDLQLSFSHICTPKSLQKFVH